MEQKRKIFLFSGEIFILTFVVSVKMLGQRKVPRPEIVSKVKWGHGPPSLLREDLNGIIMLPFGELKRLYLWWCWASLSLHKPFVRGIIKTRTGNPYSTLPMSLGIRLRSSNPRSSINSTIIIKLLFGMCSNMFARFGGTKTMRFYSY